MADIVISGNTSGSVTLRSPDVAGTTVLTLPTTSGTIVTTGSAASLTTSGNLTFTGTGNRITGDFSNATASSQVAFQSSTTNGQTNIYLAPNGTSTTAAIRVTNDSALANFSSLGMAVTNTTALIQAAQFGSGSFLPLAIQTGGSERLRIDTSGNVGIGTASPGQRLQVAGNTVLNAGGGNTYLEVISGASSIQIGTDGTSQFIYGVGAIPLYFATNAAERMRIDSAGNVGIGTTTMTSLLNVNGDVRVGNGGDLRISNSSSPSTTANDTFLYNDGATPTFITWVNGAERMRIDSSGRVLVGKTSTSDTVLGFKIDTAGSAYSTGTDNFWVAYSTTGSAYRFYVSNAGTINATNTTITGISDERVKENIVDLDDGLNAVMALKPRKFDWKAGKGRGIKGDRGFIAQEFETVFPDMIEEWLDPAPEGEEPYKAVNANLIPTLVKAIQELNAKVTALEKQLGAK